MLRKAKVRELCGLNFLKCLNSEIMFEKHIEGVYCGDMLSGALAEARENDLWLTVQNHKNVAAVAILKKISCIVLSKQEQASEPMLRLCSENDIAVFASSEDCFTTAVMLYEFLK